MTTKPFIQRSLILLGLALAMISISSILSYSTSAAPLDANPLAWTPESNVTVEMYELDDDGEADYDKPCTLNSIEYGCTALPEYPYNGINEFNIEGEYLPQVIAREMNPDLYKEEAALEAQAIASRSYVHYYIENTPVPPQNPYNNSVDFQAFIPHQFPQLTYENIPTNSANVCLSENLNEGQLMVCQSLADPKYISWYELQLPAKAEFFSDRPNQTVDVSWDKPYLVGVQEPISQACDANIAGNGYGMSQQGANRWARGHECSYEGAPTETGNEEGGPWSVSWNHSDQILAHYYTYVHLRNLSDQERLSPELRWNPLALTTEGSCPPIMHSGHSCTFNFTIQNTGTETWNPIYTSLGYSMWSAGTQMGEETTPLAL